MMDQFLQTPAIVVALISALTTFVTLFAREGFVWIASKRTKKEQSEQKMIELDVASRNQMLTIDSAERIETWRAMTTRVRDLEQSLIDMAGTMTGLQTSYAEQLGKDRFRDEEIARISASNERLRGEIGLLREENRRLSSELTVVRQERDSYQKELTLLNRKFQQEMQDVKNKVITLAESSEVSHIEPIK